jgi:NADPH:quinone reductase
MGADPVLDHSGDVAAQLASTKIPHVDLVLSTDSTAANIGWIAKVLRPFGHLSVVDASAPLDANTLVLKSASLHTEMLFSRLLLGGAPQLETTTKRGVVVSR